MITCTKKKPELFNCDLLVYFVRQVEKGYPECANEEISQQLKLAVDSGDFSGKDDQFLFFYPGTETNLKTKRVILVGLGKKKLNRETFRRAGGLVSAQALKTKSKKMLVVVPAALDFSADEISECLAEGLILGSYSFTKYKTKIDEDKKTKIAKIVFYPEKYAAAVRKGLQKGIVAAECGNKVRDLANEPDNLWMPIDFGLYASALAIKPRMSCTVFETKDLNRLKMGGILAVNKGSAQSPRLVILKYQTKKSAPTLLLVGKGLTFDSGGISLKPSKGMDRMKYDMCGGAAVLAAMQGIAAEQPNGINVVAVVPATENMPGSAALKPGDIITMYSGKTVEVLNTDAEGRLILADALAYGIDKFKPKAVIDLATLTGAVVVGLGHHRTALLANDDKLAARILDAGERSGEPLWRLPLGEEYTKQLKSEIADLKNIGGPAAGTITAAAFLEEFVGETPWAHLDIAGTAWDFTEKSYIPKGVSGIGARTLLELSRTWK